ncbi:NRDE family protein [Dactylosporangium sp. CA-139066]|uniref:NRDE family protein n=1 Tax=Dactylosporangium sp. CA-139066 TaxID=3239930 RepID=UPI003D946C34
MCTVLLRFDPDATWPVLIAAVRDEYLARPWEPPAEHWPGRFGGRDSTAGGTWLAVDPARPSVTALLNGFPPLPPVGDRPTRGSLPLAPIPPDDDVLRSFDAFHLVRAEPTEVSVITWDGQSVTHRLLAPGDHVIVNQGIDVNDFAPLRAAADPDPKPGLAPAAAWGDWIELLAGGEFTGAAERPLLIRKEVDGLLYGSGSATLVAIGEPGVRYDFTANPGPAAHWSEIPLPN